MHYKKVHFRCYRMIETATIALDSFNLFAQELSKKSRCMLKDSTSQKNTTCRCSNNKSNFTKTSRKLNAYKGFAWIKELSLEIKKCF